VLLDVCAAAHSAPVIQPSVARVTPTASDTIALRVQLDARNSGMRTSKAFAMSIDILLDRFILYAACSDKRKPTS
jgi:hypothetical protein